MMTRKNNAAMRESNGNIDHKNVVIIWINFADEVTVFLNSIHKRRPCSNFFYLRSNLDHIFGSKKDKLFCPVFVFHMSNAICHLQNEGLNISWMYPGTIPFQYLKMIFTIQYFTLSLTGSQFIFLKCNGSIWDHRGKFRQTWLNLFWAFWNLNFKVFFKRGNHEEHP